MNAAKTADHIDCECAYCGTAFRVSPNKKADGGGVYCSKHCKDQARRAAQRDCSVCGTTYTPRADRLMLPKGYCSKTCSGLDRRYRVECTCPTCGAGFETRQGRIDAGRGVYCSKACQFPGQIDRFCERCGDHFMADRSELAKGWGRFCSNRCRRTRLEHICKTCGDVFEVELAMAQSGKGVYCSVDCRGLGMRNRVVLECTHCRKQFEMPASHSDRQFCSRACSTEARKNDPDEIERVRQMQRDHLASKEPTKCERALYTLMDRVFGEGHWAREFLIFDKWTVDACVPGMSLVVQADGDYWHGLHAKNRDHPKIARNMQNDRSQAAYLRKVGWNLVRLWEHELLRDPDSCEARLIEVRDAVGVH